MPLEFIFLEYLLIILPLGALLIFIMTRFFQIIFFGTAFAKFFVETPIRFKFIHNPLNSDFLKSIITEILSKLEVYENFL